MEEYKEEKIKGCYRFCPCPSYDIRGTEEWLTDMASKGYHLEKKGIVLGSLFCFIKGEKKEVRYRLQATGWRDEPEDEVQEVSREYGWEYVDIRGDFYIWRTEDASARELITDSTVHAAAVEVLQKQQRNSIIWTIIEGVFFLILTRFSFLTLPICFGTWRVLLIGACLLYMLIKDIRKVKTIGKIKKQLLLGETPKPTYPWREKKGWYHFKNVAENVIWIVVVLLIVQGSLRLEGIGVGTSEKEAEVPFITMKELCTEPEVTTEREVHVVKQEKWWDLLASVNYVRSEKYETGGWNEESGSRSGYWNNMTVCYHETWFPWMAKCIAKEYHRLERTQDMLSMKRYEDITPDITLPGVDYLKVYAFYSIEPRAVIVKGKKVMYIRFHQWGDGRIPLEEWLTAVAASF